MSEVTKIDATLDPLLSTRRVCQAIDVSDRCLRRWVRAGKFPPPDIQVGRTLRWRASTIRNFIEGGI